MSKTKLEVIAEDKRTGLFCDFEYYNKNTNSMEKCGEPAILRVGKNNKKCLCKNCSVNARLILNCKVVSLNGNYFNCIDEAIADK